MNRTIVLKFPNPKDFFDWLKLRGIHEYGSVVMQVINPTKEGVPFVTFSVRMSAKDSERSEIVRCEVQFYNGIWISREHNGKEAESAEKEMKEYILKVHKEAFKDYEVKVIPAEFSIGEDKD